MRQLKVSLSLFLLISLVGRCIETMEISTTLGEAELKDLNSTMQSQMRRILQPLKQMDIQLGQKISLATSRIPAKIREDFFINDKINNLETMFVQVDLLFESSLKNFLLNLTDEATKNEVINNIVDSRFNLMSTIRQLYWTVLDTKNSGSKKNFLTRLNDQLQMHTNDLCDDTLSPQQHLFDIYINIIITETKALLLNAAAYFITTTNHISYQHILEREVDSFVNRTNEYREAIRQELEKAPRGIHRCDPSKHERGNTFIEFEKAQQPYIFNEDQYQPREQCSACRKKVSEIGNQLTFQTGNTVGPVEKVSYPVSRPCNGTIHSCDKFGYFFDYGGEVCLLPEDSVKRYGWIKSYSSDVTYGDSSQCDGKVIKPLYKHMWKKEEAARFYYSPTLYRCHYCLCICEDQHPLKTLRAINIRGLLTNTAENMVVTGIRLVEQNRVIHVQMKRGKLLPRGKVDPDSESWMPLEEMDYMKNEIKFNESHIESMFMDQDYVVINNYDFNLVLEDIMADKNTAICGVKFQAVNQNQFKGIKLQIATAPFNWISGTIDSECQWQSERSNNLVEQASSNLDIIKKMENLNDPLRSKSNIPDLKNTIIKFSMSDMNKDAGQSMVPFLDALPVETKPAAPLGGVGLFHKGAPGFGGFISPRIYNVDLTDYMRLFRAN